MSELYTAAAGGALIGLGATLLWAGAGRVAGISSIFIEALRGGVERRGWRVAFVVGLIGTGGLLARLRPGSVVDAPGSALLLALCGLVVGFGVRLGGGCTSGHGVCGLARGSVRSLVATTAFMFGGMLAVAAAAMVTGEIE